MPPKQLPADVWIYVFKTYITRRDDTARLASTSRALRELGLPELFRELTVTFEGNSRTEDEALLRLSFIFGRVVALREQRYLLDHIRVFKIHFAPPPDWEKSYISTWSTTYEAAINLLLDIPQIIRLQLHYCPITPRMCSYIRHHGTLRSLTLWACESDAGTPPDYDTPVHNSLGLQELTYVQRKVWQFPCQLLEFCISSLASLAIPHAEVPRVSETIGQRLHSLTHLTMNTYPSDRNRSPDVSRLLKCCSGLRSLNIRTLGPGLCPLHIDLAGISTDVLPHLESVGGDLHVITALVPGRPVRRINLHDTNSAPIRCSDVLLLSASTVQVTDLTVEISKQFAFSDQQLKHLGNSFPDVQTLKFCFDFCRIDGEKKTMNFVAFVLLQWQRLRKLSIIFKDFTKLTDTSMRRFAQPPKSTGLSPTSLKEIHVETATGGFTWLWFPIDGWVLCELEGPGDDLKHLY